MTNLFCFSGVGHSRSVADDLARHWALDLQWVRKDAEYRLESDLAIIVFPVYNQNIPRLVKDLLPRIRAQHIALLATYGGISFGNVLYEAKQLVRGKVIAATALSTGHSYLSEGVFYSKKELDLFIGQIAEQKEVIVQKSWKNPLADFFPEVRSRLGVDLFTTENCNRCGRCEEECPMKAINDCKTTDCCIRCLRCVAVCPQHARQFRLGFWMNLYLKLYSRKAFPPLFY